VSTTEWAQPALYAPPVITASLTAGVVTGEDHAQLQIEVRSATDGGLLALESCPHVSLDRLDMLLSVWAEKLRHLVTEHTAPF
jgi:hypothetical protein